MSRALAGVRADQKYSYRKLESIGVSVRSQLSFRTDEPINPLRLFEDLHEIRVEKSDGTLVPLGYGVIELEDSEGYALYDRERSLIEVLASHRTYERLRRGHPRAAYFVAHELGHCLLHTDQLIRLAQMPTNQQTAFHRGRRDHRAFEDTEWQANAFAGALLMPARGLVLIEQRFGCLEVERVAELFRVSTEAAGYRIETFVERRNELLS